MLIIYLCILVSLSIANVSPYTCNNNATFKNYCLEKPINQNLIRAMIEILSTCRPSTVTQEIYILGGEYNEFLRQRYFENVSVGLLDEITYRSNGLESFALTKYSFTAYESFFMNLLQKAHRFLFAASSQPILRAILQKTKDSPWANSEGLYILVDSKSQNCTKARSFLWTAWEYDLLSVIFMCTDSDDGIVLYTYNPYTNYTPSNWKEVARAKGRNGHPFIILTKPYDGVENITCENLDFDKTRSLDGYVIRLNAVEMEPFIKINMSAPDLEKFRGDSSEIIKILLLKLKAQLVIEVSRSSIYILGGIGPNKTLTGLLAPISDGRIDIGMNVRSLLSLWKVRYTYPHTRSGLCIFTKPIPAVSSFVKLITFLSPGALAGIILMCLLTYVMFTQTEGYIKSALQIIRLVVCVAVPRPPKMNSSRILLCMAFILFLNVNALFQSHLSFLLTVPVYYHHNIDTLEGLKESGYSIYGPSDFKRLLSDPVLESRYITVTYNECKEFVENSTNAACLGDCFHIYYRIKNKNLVKSKMLREMIQSYVTREDWPLLNRVNHIIQMMMEAGLIVKSRHDSLLEIKREMKIKEAQENSFKVMLLSQLTFSFYFLGVGYACATVIFILELIVGAPTSRS